MENPVEILLIEDNRFEAELAIKSLEKNNLANMVLHIDDGEEALDFIFCRGKYQKRANVPHPKLILVDLKLPKINGLHHFEGIKKCISVNDCR